MKQAHTWILKTLLLIGLAGCAQVLQEQSTPEGPSVESRQARHMSIRGRTELPADQLRHQLELRGIELNSWIEGIFTVYVTQDQYEWLRSQDWVKSLETAGTATLKKEPMEAR